MSLSASSLDFRLRGEWLSATLKTAQDAVARGAADALDPCVDGFLENTASFARLYDSFLDRLRSTGLPTDRVADTVAALRFPLDTGRRLLEELTKHASHRRADLENAHRSLDRIERGLVAFAPVLEPMKPDLDLIRRGLEEAARGEGEDSGDLLRRYLQSGRL